MPSQLSVESGKWHRQFAKLFYALKRFMRLCTVCLCVYARLCTKTDGQSTLLINQAKCCTIVICLILFYILSNICFSVRIYVSIFFFLTPMLAGYFF